MTHVHEADDDDGELTLWSSEVDLVELEKDRRGLGFSILDYEVSVSGDQWPPLHEVSHLTGMGCPTLGIHQEKVEHKSAQFKGVDQRIERLDPKYCFFVSFVFSPETAPLLSMAMFWYCILSLFK